VEGALASTRTVLAILLALAMLAVSVQRVSATACAGDCDEDGEVDITELIIAVNIALEEKSVDTCPSGDLNGDGTISVEEIIVAINRALLGCPPALAVCSGSELGPCWTSCGGLSGNGCCTLTDPPGCFDPRDGSIIDTPCGASPEDACTLVGAPTLTPTGTATPSPTPEIEACSGAQLGPCWTTCGDSGVEGCCTATDPPGCFDPTDGSIVDTACAANPGDACTLAGAPTLTPTPTATTSPTPGLMPCTGADLTSCAAVCGDPGREGCCTLTDPPGCFDPSAGSIIDTPCGSQPDAACVLGQPTPSETPESSPTATPEAETPTPTVPVATPTASMATSATDTPTVTPTGPPPSATETPSETPTGPTETPAVTPTGTPCRVIEVVNNASQTVWIGAVGGTVEPACIDGITSCLPQPTPGASCACNGGAADGTLVCPGTASPTFNNSTNSWYCACDPDVPASCGGAAACASAASIDKCFWTAPAPMNPTPAGNVWALAPSGSASFCLPPPPSIEGVSAPVWWGGGIFGRTGCQPDGTQCATADCSAESNGPCAFGTGGALPYSQAEFTLQTLAADFYDVTMINGANLAVAMAPTRPTATPAAGDPAAYWCGVPGSANPAPTPGLSACSWDLRPGQIPITPTPGIDTDYQALLLNSYRPCSTAETPTPCPTPKPGSLQASCTPGSQGPGCWQCSGAPGQCFIECNSDDDCADTDLPACVNGYCQCTGDNDCGSGYCGTQRVTGVAIGLQKLCGSFAGWWTADDLCSLWTGLGQTSAYGPLDCSQAITDGDMTSTTTLSNLLGCVGPNGASCYNTTSENANCCGCATDPSNAALYPLWPTEVTASCDANNPTWASAAGPWLGYLKQACPTAYSYPYDDPTSTFKCYSNTGLNIMSYQITFSDLPTPAPVATATPTS
jgi:hypothetical protein